MISALLRLLDSPEREARRLNRDTSVIIESAEQSYRAETMRDIALMTLEHLGKAGEQLEDQPESRDELVSRFRQQHREARRRMDHVALTAYTLVIIYLRAQRLGDRAGGAVRAIDDFTGRWSHAT
jgi:16S rRNA U1498 N3-methylase RsmE